MKPLGISRIVSAARWKSVGSARARAWLRWVAVWKRAAMPSMWGGLDARSRGWRVSSGVSLYSKPEGREWEHVPQRVEREVRRMIPDHEKNNQGGAWI